jgi:magnesium chelatase family protein
VRQYRERLKEVVHACFAIEIEVPLIEKEVTSSLPQDNAATIRQRVGAARLIQHRRYAGCTHLRVNADLLDPHEVEQYCQMLMPSEDLLKTIRKQLHLTPLQVLRVRVVARTIADLDEAPLIEGKHMAEAILYLSRFIRYEGSGAAS